MLNTTTCMVVFMERDSADPFAVSDVNYDGNQLDQRPVNPV